MKRVCFSLNSNTPGQANRLPIVIESMLSLKNDFATMKKGVCLLFIFIFSIYASYSKSKTSLIPNEKSAIKQSNYSVAIPFYGNSWVINEGKSVDGIISPDGVKNWRNGNELIRFFFKTEKTGDLNLALKARSEKGKSSVRVQLNGQSETVIIKTDTFSVIPVGSFHVSKPGYQVVEIQGIKKQGEDFAELSDLMIGGEAAQGKIYFVRDDFYWGQRGPSVHLNYPMPENSGDALYFYNEMTIPEGNDVIGSYFMANGFSQGYFGIQVNSETERRVLFSVWSPFKTDDPKNIPDDHKIIMLKKGEHVHTGEFGNEGSGGQSYLKYNWIAGNTYRFLLKGVPSSNKSTDFTAWFYAPERGEWMLIASFRRPHTSSYLTRLHSFLENFIPSQGQFVRQVHYSNQWIYTADDKWVELTKAGFSADATARKQSRMDYAGGGDQKSFYLKNCGFFSENTPIGATFERAVQNNPPVIEWNKLP